MMNVDSAHALVGTGIHYRPVRGHGGEQAAGGVRPEHPPVERVIEGELLGRRRARVETSAGLFDGRLRCHASADNGQACRTDFRGRAAVAAYLGTAAAEPRRIRTSLDLYA